MPKKIIYTLLSILLTSVVFAGDTTSPVTTLSKIPSSPNGKENWYLNPVEIILNATDLESGIKEIGYKVNDNPWGKKYFYQTLNLAPNPSFEYPNLESWEMSVKDEFVTATQDYTEHAPSFENSSAKIVSSGIGWHGIDHMKNFAVTSPYTIITASAWIKTESVYQNAYFKIYSVSLDQNKNMIKTYLGQSSTITGTNGWAKLSKSIPLTDENSMGIFIDIGLEGTGTMWIDAVNINKSATQEQASFFVSTDGTNTIQYYSTDQAGNTEPVKSVSIKIDQTPPNNWGDSIIIHDSIDPEYLLKIQTNVEDQTSGILNLTKRYQYKVDREYGRYADVANCHGRWKEHEWGILEEYSNASGVHSTTLRTPKVSFCDDSWDNCKAVKFEAIDVAGNTSIKNYCINGAWIKTSNGGKVKATYGINMTAEAPDNNTDGLVESGNNLIEFFTSPNNYKARNTSPLNNQTYDDFWGITQDKTEISNINTNSGVFYINNNYTITSLPANFSNETFNQIVFINGNLTIDTNILISNSSTILFIVKGNVKINKNVQDVQSALISDKTIYTAYNIISKERTQPLELKGIFSANKFNFQRTLQANDQPAEYFIYEPKYLIEMKGYMGESQMEWVN